MAVLSQKVTNNQSVTITLASLANGGFATSNAIANSSNFIYGKFQLKIKTGAAGVVANGFVVLRIVSSGDGGTTYDDSNVNAQPIGTILANANATAYIATFNSEDIGYELPDFFKVVVENETGAALDATAGNFSLTYIGVQKTIA